MKIAGLWFMTMIWWLVLSGHAPGQEVIQPEHCVNWPEGSMIQPVIQPVHLEDIWKNAMVFHPKIRIAQIDMEIRQTVLESSQALFLPKIDVEGQWERQEVNLDHPQWSGSDLDGYKTTWSGIAQWNVYAGGGDIAERKNAWTGLEESRHGSIEQTTNAILEILERYGNLLMLWKTLEHEQLELKRAQGQLERVDASLKQGIGTRQELNNLLYEISRTRERLNDAQNSLFETSDTLSMLIGQPVATRHLFYPRESHLPEMEILPEMDWNEAILNHPRMRAAVMRTRQAELAIQQARAPFFPRVDLQFRETWQGFAPNAPEDSIEANEPYLRSYSIVLRQSLFSGNQDQGALRSAILNHQKTKVEENLVSQGLKQEIMAVLHSLRIYQNTLATQNSARRQAEHTLRLHTALLERGQGTRNDVNEAESRIAQINLEHYKLEIQYRMLLWKALSYARGEQFPDVFERETVMNPANRNSDCDEYLTN
ncbi:MAG: TolC family protein [SAR324 cluster bacterium]|nr:TolC family protein [SAR324 cluster bacterium]